MVDGIVPNSQKFDQLQHQINDFDLVEGAMETPEYPHDLNDQQQPMSINQFHSDDDGHQDDAENRAAPYDSPVDLNQDILANDIAQ